MRDFQSEYDSLKKELDEAIRDKRASDLIAIDSFKLGENFASSHPIEHRSFIEAEYRRELIQNEIDVLVAEARACGVHIKN